MKSIVTIFFSLMALSQLLAQANTNLGTNAGNSGNDNTSVGNQAGDAVTGNYNAFFGSFAGKYNTTGTQNSFFGYNAGGSTTTGSYNLFLGRAAGYGNTTGNNNVLLGYYSGRFNVTGANNTAIGYSSGFNVTGSGNVFLGYEAGYNETGSNKLYIDNSNTTTPLIYGDFSSNQVGINTLPTSTYALNVGGTINATGLFVNGQPIVAGSSQWTTSGVNINYNTAGMVSIGTTTAPAGYKLAVGGKIVAEEIVVKLQANWPDYVFEKDYKLQSLRDLNLFIAKNKHLPGVPSAREIEESGVSVGEMNIILLKKIEELTLHLIKQQAEIDVLKRKIN